MSAAVLAFLALPAHALAATTFHVTKTADTNDGSCKATNCSLRDAVIASNATAPGPNAIVLNAGLYKLNHTGQGEQDAATGDLDVKRSVSITGSTAATTTIDGNGTDRVFETLTGANLSLSKLTIRGGNPAPESYYGGAIMTADGSLTLTNITLTTNHAGAGSAGYGGAIAMNGGAGALTISHSTITGNTAGGSSSTDYGYGGVASDSATGLVTISDSTLSGNHAGGNDAFGYGGVLYNGGAVTFTRDVISGNTAGGGPADGPGYGGVVSNSTPITIVQSSVSNNRAGDVKFGYGGVAYASDLVTIRASSVRSNRAGGGSTSGPGYGGAVSGDKVDVLRSTLSDNHAGGDGSFGYGGAIYGTIVTLTDSLVSKNVSGGGGSSGQGYGGAVSSDDVTVRRSTLAGNTADAGSFAYGGALYSITATLDNSTVSGNKAGNSTAYGYGGGVSANTIATFSTIANNDAPSSGAPGGGGGVYGDLTAKDTIVADNTSPHGPNCSGGTFTSNGHNLENGTSCGFAPPADLIAEPKLGLLANYGGPTPTRSLLPTSPAINAAAADCPPPSTDQRGAPRPQGGGCDIGAFEVQPAAVITALKMTPRKLRAKKSGPTISSKRKKKPPRGAVVSYRDSRAALTTFTVLKGLPGVRSGKLCVAPKKPAPKHPKRCTRYRAVGKFTHQDVVGANHFKFSGRLKGHKLAPAHYRLVAVPRLWGVTGKQVTTGFVIVE